MLSASLKILALTFCPLLLALCLFSVPACKKPTEPKAALPDTTSHDFVFELDTLGNGSSSVLNDVWIFDENNIWAVGEIYVRDSTGQAEEVYNAVHWDGKKWNLKKVLVRDLGGFTFITPLKAVIGFSAKDVWVAGDADLIHWNGSSWSGKALFITDLTFNGQVLKMWGTSGSNIYCVGRNGAIYHYDGSTWQKLVSGIDLDIRDIWGARNEKTGELEILAVASKLRLAPPIRKILKLTEKTVETVADSGIAQESLAGIWFSPGKKYVVVGSGIYRKNHLQEPRWLGAPLELTEFYSSHVRGVAANDIFVVGAFGDILHFNGSTWKQYPELRIPGSLCKVAFSHQTMAAVGYIGKQAAVVTGKRF